MKLINPKVEIIPQEEGLLGVYKQIEKAGRTCYKSEDRITEDSAEKFVKKMIDLGHTAMLEHGTIYLMIPCPYDNYVEWDKANTIADGYYDDKYSKVAKVKEGKNHTFYITTNYRVLVENHWLNDLKYLSVPAEHHATRITARFICDRGILAELTRHRTFSFAVESTRYCNYSKSKFGGKLTYIIPSWWDSANESTKRLFLDSLSTSEDCYMEMLDNGCTPQQARQVLPNALKTEVVMTGFVSDWKHFFRLRCAKNAHPDMQLLANQLKQSFIDSGINLD